MTNRIIDEFTTLPSKQIRWTKRNPEKFKEIKRRYEQSEKGRATAKKYRERK